MDKLGPYDLDTIVTGDARELARAIPDESVDLIVCDPVYWQIDDYRWLGQLGERVLIPGGNLIAQVGSEYRFHAEVALRESSLIPRPLIAEVYPGAGAQMFKHKTFTGWKPHIWMSKGQRIGGWIFDRIRGGGAQKDTHAWQDSPSMFVDLVRRLTDADAVIIDPFTGGGTVPAVCKMLCRHYLAFEIDPTTAERARERVHNTQPPLFVLEPEQAAMFVPDN